MAAYEAHVVHRTPERLRLRVPARKGDAAFFESLRSAMESAREGISVEVNPTTSSVLVRARRGTDGLLSEPAVRGFIEATAEVPASGARTSMADGGKDSRTLVDAVATAYTDLDARLKEASGGAWDMRSLVFLGLVAGGSLQLVRGKVMPAGVALLNSALLMVSKA